MVLAFDVGNTHIVMGCIDDSGIHNVTRMATDKIKTESEYAMTIKGLLDFSNISPDSFDGAIISSVVPPLTTVLVKAVKLVTGLTPMIVGAGVKTGVNIQIDNPAEAGSDLVVAAAAALKLYELPAIIIDMGTATTLTVIDKSGSFLGGAIVPGVGLSLDALANSASLLPKISFEAPKNCIGRNTIDCMKSGSILGSASLLDGMIDRMTEELGEEKVTLVATGGIASSIIPYCKHNIIINNDLLLQGLYVIYNKNKRK